MDSRAAFQCSSCKEVFHKDGLHVSIHGKAVGHICPACLDNAKVLQLSLKREGPGKPYEFNHYLVLEKIFTE
jgi:hypothetical protein